MRQLFYCFTIIDIFNFCKMVGLKITGDFIFKEIKNIKATLLAVYINLRLQTIQHRIEVEL